MISKSVVAFRDPLRPSEAQFSCPQCGRLHAVSSTSDGPWLYHRNDDPFGWGFARPEQIHSSQPMARIVYTDRKLPAEAQRIDKKARNLVGRLSIRYLRDPKGWRDTSEALLDDLEELKAAALRLNVRYLEKIEKYGQPMPRLAKIAREALKTIMEEQMQKTTIAGIEVRPGMTQADGRAVMEVATRKDIRALTGDAAIALHVAIRGGESWVDSFGNLDFRMPPPSAEEQAAQDRRRRAVLAEYSAAGRA